MSTWSSFIDSLGSTGLFVGVCVIMTDNRITTSLGVELNPRDIDIFGHAWFGLEFLCSAICVV